MPRAVALSVWAAVALAKAVPVCAGLAVPVEVPLPRGVRVCTGGEKEAAGDAVPEALPLPRLPSPPMPPLAVAAALLLTLPAALPLARALGVPPRPLAAPASPLAVAGAEAAEEAEGLWEVRGEVLGEEVTLGLPEGLGERERVAGAVGKALAEATPLGAPVREEEVDWLELGEKEAGAESAGEGVAPAVREGA